MLAAWYEKTGPAAKVFRLGDVPTPAPGHGEILVRLHASGINPSDYKRRGNEKASVEFPRVIPHSDGAGVIAALGEGVQYFRIGDRVWVFNAQWGRPHGTAAEYVCLPESRVKPLPLNLSFEEGACLGIPAMTGYHAVHAAGAVRGKWIYIPGATGRVAAYALQFAKWRGARVIASTGSIDARRNELLSLGADLVLDRKAGDLESAILEATDGRGVDQIVEVNLAENIGTDERLLAEGGAIVSFGAASAPFIPIKQIGRRARNMQLLFIFVYQLSEPTFVSTCLGVNDFATSGRLINRIAATFPLADIAKAHEYAETTSGDGHVVVTL